MREQPSDLAIEDANELPALGHRDAEEFLGCQTERRRPLTAVPALSGSSFIARM
jgi:hypothetical protein